MAISIMCRVATNITTIWSCVITYETSHGKIKNETYNIKNKKQKEVAKAEDTKRQKELAKAEETTGYKKLKIRTDLRNDVQSSMLR